MTDIFISYSRKDIDMVTVLARTLEELGYSVWWDVSGLHGGQSFASVIQEKLAEAKCAIVVWSPDSVKSSWVHSEASFADKRGILLTTVYREADAPMPFNTRHNENLRDWNGNIFDDGFQRLHTAVRRLCPVPSGSKRPLVTASESTVEPRQTGKGSEDTEKVQTEHLKKETGKVNKWGVIGGLAVVIAGGAYTLIPPKTNDEFNIKSSTAQKIVPLAKAVNEPAPIKTTTDFTKISKSVIESAKAALEDNRLISPENNNVVHFARQILKTDPQNAEIRTFLVQATSRLHGLAELDFAGKSYLTAKSYLKHSQNVINEFSLVQSQATQDKIETQFASAFEEGLKVAAEKAASSKIYKLENNLTLLPIPAGSFLMGSESGRDSEKPVHKVTFEKPFWMSKTEITFDQYDAYVKAAGKSLPEDEKWGRETRPVINVSWDDSQGYVKWLSQNNKKGLQCRLPSEAEWEYAARAGSTTKYPWGDNTSHEQANYGTDVCCKGLAKGHDQWVNTAPVGSFPENKWGLQDMHGNIWEWVQDPWHNDYKGAPINGAVWDKGGDEGRRVLRGGSWLRSPLSLRSAGRGSSLPDSRYYSIGFRVVCSPPSVR